MNTCDKLLRTMLAALAVNVAVVLCGRVAHADPLIEGVVIWDVSRISDRNDCRVELTDLIRFEDAWYCAFREGEIHHNHPSGRGRVIRSSDGETWASVALFDWDGADVREPRFSITPEGWLMVNTSVFFCSGEPRRDGAFYQLNRRGTPETVNESEVARQSVTWLSPDGVNWSSAHACPTGVNTWRWDVAWHNGMGYSVGYLGKDRAGTLYRTRDGKSWRQLSTNFFPDKGSNEASLAFLGESVAACLLRVGSRRAMVGVGAGPSWRNWEWRNLRVDWAGDGQAKPCQDVLRAPFGGPKLIRLSDGRLFAAGRVLGPGRDDGHITLFQVDLENAVLVKFAEFAGTSYAGVVEHDGKLWVTSSSSDTKVIYLAAVSITGQ